MSRRDLSLSVAKYQPSKISVWWRTTQDQTQLIPTRDKLWQDTECRPKLGCLINKYAYRYNLHAHLIFLELQIFLRSAWYSHNVYPMACSHNWPYICATTSHICMVYMKMYFATSCSTRVVPGATMSIHIAKAVQTSSPTNVRFSNKMPQDCCATHCGFITKFNNVLNQTPPSCIPTWTVWNVCTAIIPMVNFKFHNLPRVKWNALHLIKLSYLSQYPCMSQTIPILHVNKIYHIFLCSIICLTGKLLLVIMKSYFLNGFTAKI